jgi:DsbC/DsbD-like thiol-disulfide interchange protein
MRKSMLSSLAPARTPKEARTMTLRRIPLLAALCTALLLTTAVTVRGQGKKSDAVVKAKASAEKPSAGKEVVTVTLEIDPKYHIYANPVGNPDHEASQTVVSVTGKSKLESVKIDYPAGTVVKDSVVGDYKVYTGKVTIKATVQRAGGDSSALEVAVKLQACSKTSCLLPATIKVAVP